MDTPDLLAQLEGRLGYTFTDRSFLLIALRHRSYIHEVRSDVKEGEPVEDNQRFEFLGDAVLSLCISTLLYETFPKDKEGELSKMRAGLVNESQLANIARSIGVAPCLALGRGEEATGGRDKSSILADAFEAILAAIYLDGGFTAAINVVEHLLGDLIVKSSTQDFLKDYKTRLQELTQELFNKAPVYRLDGTEGPDHSKTFVVTLTLGAEEVAVGQGRSKKEAERSAARAALQVLQSRATSSK
ncbi:MAG: ribonuclease III [Deltaproteobacteria bacterium]|nr:ribonuclease III [Deltaproteobacteria bacterium]MBW2051699.1 ribonuclease III [Deltaproteobacteria bacterium]MBW2139972.1 ribonuclease III [Deltaproteobacteria bacterium]MBW2322319.1 ribonuclease III [Deltaproteobacteria bacterium]